MRRLRFLWLLALASSPLAVLGSPAERITVLVEYRDHELRVTDSQALAKPGHHAGYYVQWANQRAFLERAHLVEGVTYRIRARVERVEVGQFPQGWGSRSGKSYSTYYLKAESATKVGGAK